MNEPLVPRKGELKWPNDDVYLGEWGGDEGLSHGLGERTFHFEPAGGSKSSSSSSSSSGKNKVTEDTTWSIENLCLNKNALIAENALYLN